MYPYLFLPAKMRGRMKEGVFASFALLCFKICAPRANLMTTQNISDSEIPPAKARRAPSSDNNFLRGLCVFAGDIPNLCCGSAALGSLR